MNLRRKLITKYNLKPTKTTVFFIPIFEYSLPKYTKNFINFYIKDHKKRKLVIVFEESEDEDFNIFISILAENPYFSQCWNDDNELIIEMEIPITFHYDFQMFLEGKYSEFSDKFKNMLTRFYGKEQSANNKVTMYEVLYPSEEKRKLIANELDVDVKIMPNEVFSIPKLDDEKYLTIEEFNNKYKEISII